MQNTSETYEQTMWELEEARVEYEEEQRVEMEAQQETDYSVGYEYVNGWEVR